MSPSAGVPRKPGIRRTQAGFTLIELALVVLLIGLFSALALPTLTGIGRDTLALSARRLAGTVKYLYNESALSGRPYRMIYDLDRGAFRAKRLEENGELVDVKGTGREQRLKGDARFKEIRVVGRGTFSTGEVTVDILPAGWMEETIIHLAGSRDRALTLRIVPFTGTTEIYEGHREF